MLHASAVAFQTLKYLGVAYLLYMAWNALREHGALKVENEIGARSASVCHLGNLAYWNHRRLKWDPAKEKFVGDDEANKLVDLPRRKGYELPTV